MRATWRNSKFSTVLSVTPKALWISAYGDCSQTNTHKHTQRGHREHEPTMWSVWTLYRGGVSYWRRSELAVILWWSENAPRPKLNKFRVQKVKPIALSTSPFPPSSALASAGIEPSLCARAPDSDLLTTASFPSCQRAPNVLGCLFNTLKDAEFK